MCATPAAGGTWGEATVISRAGPLQCSEAKAAWAQLNKDWATRWRVQQDSFESLTSSRTSYWRGCWTHRLVMWVLRSSAPGCASSVRLCLVLLCSIAAPSWCLQLVLPSRPAGCRFAARKSVPETLAKRDGGGPTTKSRQASVLHCCYVMLVSQILVSSTGSKGEVVMDFK